MFSFFKKKLIFSFFIFFFIPVFYNTVCVCDGCDGGVGEGLLLLERVAQMPRRAAAVCITRARADRRVHSNL